MDFDPIKKLSNKETIIAYLELIGYGISLALALRGVLY